MEMKSQTDSIKGVHIVTFLVQRLNDAAFTSKSERTRLRLITAAASVMEAYGYEGLTIDAVVKKANVARGTFYRYFKDKSDVAMSVMKYFSEAVEKYRPRGGSALPAIQSIYNTNLFYCLSYIKN